MKYLKIMLLFIAASVTVGCSTYKVDYTMETDITAYVRFQQLTPEEKQAFFDVDVTNYLFDKYGRNTIMPVSKYMSESLYRQGILHNNSASLSKLIAKYDNTIESVGLASCNIHIDLPELEPTLENVGKVVEGPYGFATVEMRKVLSNSDPRPFKLYYTTYNKFVKLSVDDNQKAKECFENVVGYYPYQTRPSDESLEVQKAHQEDMKKLFLTQNIYKRQIALAMGKPIDDSKPTKLILEDLEIEKPSTINNQPSKNAPDAVQEPAKVNPAKKPVTIGVFPVGTTEEEIQEFFNQQQLNKKETGDNLIKGEPKEYIDSPIIPVAPLKNEQEKEAVQDKDIPNIF